MDIKMIISELENKLREANKTPENVYYNEAIIDAIEIVEKHAPPQDRKNTQ